MKTCILFALLLVSLASTSENPKILIDTGHGGYPLKENKLSEFENLAETKGFSVDFADIKTVNLANYSLVLSANPDKTFSSQEAVLLKKYVNQGGIFFLTGSGDYKDRDHSKVTNALLKALSSTTRFNDDQVIDHINSGEPYIPLLDTWNPHPLTASLPSISLYSPESVTAGDAYPLLYGNPSSRSTDNDGHIAAVNGRIVLLAVERMGKGDLLVGGSWRFFSELQYQGRSEFAEQLLAYISTRHSIPNYKAQFKNASIVIGEQCRPEVDAYGAKILARILQGTIVPQGTETTVIVGGPSVNPLCEKINQYLPVPFAEKDSWYLTRNGKEYYGQEYGIIAVITVGNSSFLVAAGTGGTGTRGAINILEHINSYELTPCYNAYGEAIVFKVSGDTTFNGVEEASEQWEIYIL